MSQTNASTIQAPAQAQAQAQASIAEQLVAESDSTKDLIEKCEWKVAATRETHLKDSVTYHFMDGSNIRIAGGTHEVGFSEQAA